MTDVEEERLKRPQGSCEVDDESKSRVVITGAATLLGRALYKEFIDNSWNVLGFEVSRSKPWIIEVDLSPESIVEVVRPQIVQYKPKAIIHCASVRSPLQIEFEYYTAQDQNNLCAKLFAELAGELNIAFLYISTDNVFDGENPPYKESDDPNPLNEYGLAKWEGEKAVMKANPDSCVLRIPVLYGNEEYIGESDVSSLFTKLKNIRQEPVEVSTYEIKFPSFTSDVAAICYKLIEQKLLDRSINSIFHWCGSEGLTNYEICVILGEEFSYDYAHLVPVNSPPEPTSNPICPRPKNTQLSCNRLIDMGIGQHTPFKDGIKSFYDLAPRSCTA